MSDTEDEISFDMFYKICAETFNNVKEWNENPINYEELYEVFKETTKYYNDDYSNHLEDTFKDYVDILDEYNFWDDETPKKFITMFLERYKEDYSNESIVEHFIKEEGWKLPEWLSYDYEDCVNNLIENHKVAVCGYSYFF